MKIFTLFLFSIFSLSISHKAYAQCQAFAGSPLHYCASFQAPLDSLGAVPAATGGQEPYSYSWHIQPQQLSPGSGIILHASDFLSDTTAARPLFTGGLAQNPSLFYLTVRDALGCTATDSVWVGESVFTQHLGNLSYRILKGDSVQVRVGPNISSSHGQASILWRPNSELIDSTHNYFWARPQETTDYYCIITDSMGCTAEGSPFVRIEVESLGDPEVTLPQWKIFPNPVQERIFFKDLTAQGLQRITIVDVQGREVFSTSSAVAQINTETLPAGIYLLQVQNQKGLSEQRFVKTHR